MGSSQSLVCSTRSPIILTKCLHCARESQDPHQESQGRNKSQYTTGNPPRPTYLIVAAMLFTRSREQATTPGADRCTRESKRETTETHTERDGERGGRIEIEQAIGQKGGLEETTQTWQTRGRVFGCHLQGESTLAQQGQHWARADHYKTHTQVQGRQSVAKALILKSDSHFSQCWP